MNTPKLTLRRTPIKIRKRRDLLGHIKPVGNVEADSKEELSETLKIVREADKREQRRFADTTDSEYWACLVFQNRAQKEAFLTAMEWIQHGDKWLDGIALARQHGIEMPSAATSFAPEKSTFDQIETISDPRKKGGETT